MSGKPRKAWQIDRELRLSAVPIDRRTRGSEWYDSSTVFPTGDDLVAMFWNSKVPGSMAPELPYVEMVESMANRGFDMAEAEALLPLGLELSARGDRSALRALTARLLEKIHSAPADPASPYWGFEHPASWEEVRGAMGEAAVELEGEPHGLEERTRAAWVGQLAGGSFGTAIEGYCSARIREVYGVISGYVTEPETVNDDVVYELAFLDAFEKAGRRIEPRDIALEWVAQIEFGWSAEWVALHNLNDGIFPPLSGSWRNPYSDWIGAQMRGMVCGMLAPGKPLEAARLAYADAVVSHSANGAYGEIYAAALTALAYLRSDMRALLVEAGRYLPQKSEYASVLRDCLDAARRSESPEAAWSILDRRFEEYNWIHAYPNLAADVVSLWFGEGDMTKSFSILAHAGLDVDCNAGLVGSVIGASRGEVPAEWGSPLRDRLETYIKGKERLSISELAARTVRLSRL